MIRKEKSDSQVKPLRRRPDHPNAKQKNFIWEYCRTGSVEEAQKLAGYTPHRQNGYRILHDPRNAAEIKRSQKKAAELLGLHAAWVLSKEMFIAGNNIHDIRKFDDKGEFVGIDLSKMTKEQSYAIQEIGFDAEGRPKIKFHDKVAALKLLHDHITPPKPQRVRLEGKDGGPVEVIDGLGARLNAARQRIKAQ